jgi:predicted DCC family thiol-disulfide oxidoreductase YuxK
MKRSWRPVDASGIPNGLILFDGVCVLCSRSVQFVLERDRDRWFRFTPIQSSLGRALALRLGISLQAPETNAVIVRGRAHFKADSAIEVLRLLPRRSWSRAFLLVPRALRDFIYDRVAQNRYRLFGRTESCMAPTPNLRARFVFEDAGATMALTPAFASRPSPFQVLLGGDFARLPAAVRRVHALGGSLQTAGRADVSAAKGMLASLLCRLAGLPAAGRDIPVAVAFHADGHLREFWQRRFGDRRYASTLRIGDPRAPGLLIERFGPFALEFRLEPSGEALAASLSWSLVGCRLLGFRLPRWAGPRIACVESAEGERFLFDIDVAFPLLGHVIHYSGWLSADAPAAASADHPSQYC